MALNRLRIYNKLPRHHPFWGVYHPYFWFNIPFVDVETSSSRWAPLSLGYPLNPLLSRLGLVGAPREFPGSIGFSDIWDVEPKIGGILHDFTPKMDGEDNGKKTY